jgi:hypothetical protein
MVNQRFIFGCVLLVLLCFNIIEGDAYFNNLRCRSDCTEPGSSHWFKNLSCRDHCSESELDDALHLSNVATDLHETEKIKYFSFISNNHADHSRYIPNTNENKLKRLQAHIQIKLNGE